MPKRIEMTPLEASQRVCSFFCGDVDLTEAFKEICEDIIAIDPDIKVRFQSDIVGVAKTDEYLRFYVVETEGTFYIKYKNMPLRDVFDPAEIEKYKANNISCCKYFDENRDHLMRKLSSNREERYRAVEKNKGYRYPMFLSAEDLEKWKAIYKKGEDALQNAKVYLDDLVFEEIYDTLLTILSDACEDETIMKHRNGDIVLNRILYPNRMTLQELGDRYDVSREYIRRLEMSSWERLKKVIYSSKKKYNPDYRIRLADLLLAIPDEAVSSTVERIYARNKWIGLLMQSLYGC